MAGMVPVIGYQWSIVGVVGEGGGFFAEGLRRFAAEQFGFIHHTSKHAPNLKVFFFYGPGWVSICSPFLYRTFEPQGPQSAPRKP